MTKGRVLKKQADQFEVEVDGKILSCVARKVLKRDGIFVGDEVILDDDNTICKLERRKNVLIRPPVSNIDRMFIVVAPVPKPDLYTVDKMLIFCKLNNIEPIICINKSDLNGKYCEEISKIYKTICKTIVVSSQNETVEQIADLIEGVCVLAGQSAVGKSSIINALKKEVVAEVGEFSKKIERGKQTTRTVQLFKFGNGKYLADTAGFSKLDETLIDLKAEEIKNYYPDFLAYAHECKYKSCEHLSDKFCGVAKAVKRGEICKERYENYLKLNQIMKGIKRF